MKKLQRITAIIALVAFASCSTFQSNLGKVNAWLAVPQNQKNIQTAAKVLASAVQLAAPFVTNKDASNALYAAGVVAGAYGNNPVPTSVLTATTESLAIAKQIVPLVGGNTNGGQAVSIINAAAQLLAQSQVSAAAVSPNP